MSSQRGNDKKSGAPKHKNRSAFKNTLHDTSKTTQIINSLDTAGCCTRCKDIIEWKIKYKKYKPLTVPKTCTRCGQKNIKRAYYIVCRECAAKHNVCVKCGQKKEILERPGLTSEEEIAQKSQLEQELKLLPERKRRTFLRLQDSGKFADLDGSSSGHEAAGGAAAMDPAEDSDVDDLEDGASEEQDSHEQEMGDISTESKDVQMSQEIFVAEGNKNNEESGQS